MGVVGVGAVVVVGAGAVGLEVGDGAAADAHVEVTAHTVATGLMRP